MSEDPFEIHRDPLAGSVPPEKPGRPGQNHALIDLNDAHLDRDKGVYAEHLLLDQAPFLVKPLPDSSGKFVVDIDIRIRDKPIPADKQQFKVQLDQTQTVVKTVLSDTGAQPRAWWGRLAPARLQGFLAAFTPPPAISPELRLDQYMRALVGIARVGLMNTDATHTPFATLALRAFREDFVSREASRIKNRYVRRLGANALLALVIALLGYLVASRLDPGYTLHRFRNFFLLAAGASVGTWLSFSIRRQVLEFADLALLEEDRLSPGLRVLFMVALTVVVGLILWTGMVTIDIGLFQTDFRQTGTYAALIGALCGIAERSLATAVGRRAGDFAASLGGSAKTSA